jgi:hypothetical protein
MEKIVSFVIINLTVCFQYGIRSTRLRWTDFLLHTVSLTGGENGFIPHARLIFKSGTKTGDYHTEMIVGNFTR